MNEMKELVLIQTNFGFPLISGFPPMNEIKTKQIWWLEINLREHIFAKFKFLSIGGWGGGEGGGDTSNTF